MPNLDPNPGGTALTEQPPLFTFVETKLFTRLVSQYLTDDEYRELQSALLESPEIGNVIRNTGGVRKLRWRAQGRGKRGGYRIIYFLQPDREVVWMLTMYPKNVADNIPAKVLRQIREEIEGV